jgi:hypothetical protein
MVNTTWPGVPPAKLQQIAEYGGISVLPDLRWGPKIRGHLLGGKPSNFRVTYLTYSNKNQSPKKPVKDLP